MRQWVWDSECWPEMGMEYLIAIISTLAFYQHVSADHTSSLPALLKLACPQDSLLVNDPTIFTHFPSFNLHLFH